MTLNKVLREAPFTIHIGKRGYKKLYWDWGIQPLQKPRFMNARHDALAFLVHFMRARPEILGEYHGRNLESGGFAKVFDDRLSVVGYSVEDAPKVLRGEGFD